MAERPDQVWAMDFEFDETREERPIKILNVTDEFTRECLASFPARSINADCTVSVTRSSSSGEAHRPMSVATTCPSWSPRG